MRLNSNNKLNQSWKGKQVRAWPQISCFKLQWQQNTCKIGPQSAKLLKHKNGQREATWNKPNELPMPNSIANSLDPEFTELSPLFQILDHNFSLYAADFCFFRRLTANFAENRAWMKMAALVLYRKKDCYEVRPWFSSGVSKTLGLKSGVS